ncbi:alpha-hydroxy acid oxidase [Gracilibacillus sp. YIM 98692]|uniref:alpha-hydroxy acid oxidase n=1 Tax=Gracilibacillus sp. YIM 98692 TaxID=2663532 RepID=UPI001F08CBD4|nr:alpha-hydroxy acid oxidase [Gracilibacillus sp. YIM 98692]
MQSQQPFPIRFDDLEQTAKKLLQHDVYEYIESGGGREETLYANTEAFKKWRIVPRFGADVSDVSLETTFNRKKIEAPILLAPIGMQGLVHPEGERATVQAAYEHGIPFIASTVASNSLEDIRSAKPEASRWFQLYYPNDSGIAKSFVQRAEKAGYEAIVVTTDMPILGNRERDIRNGYSPFALGKGKANYVQDPVFQGYVKEKDPHDYLDEMKKYFYRPSLSWNDIQTLREWTSLPIYIKGILHPDDAQQAVEIGVDGIIVSNHGGRQLDRCIPSIDALPGIKDRVGNQITILLDSGVRSGPDIVTALALGADAVLLGRPFLYGLTLGGKQGVWQVLQQLKQDLKTTLMLSGVPSVQQVDRSLLSRS